MKKRMMLILIACVLLVSAGFYMASKIEPEPKLVCVCDKDNVCDCRVKPEQTCSCDDCDCGAPLGPQTAQGEK